MFTGIIESIGKINQIDKTGFGLGISISVLEKIFNEVKIGDSVSIDGVCLTVTEKIISNNIICFDVVKETIDKTNLSNLELNDKVNIETAINATKL